MTAPPAGWHPDPLGRHELRWWDGAAWSAHVSDAGSTSDDPIEPVPTVDDLAEPLLRHIATELIADNEREQFRPIGDDDYGIAMPPRSFVPWLARSLADIERRLLPGEQIVAVGCASLFPAPELQIVTDRRAFAVSGPHPVVDELASDPRPVEERRRSNDGFVPVLHRPPRPDAAPVAGWYPDPRGKDEARFWDGRTWTRDVLCSIWTGVRSRRVLESARGKAIDGGTPPPDPATRRP